MDKLKLREVENFTQDPETGDLTFMNPDGSIYPEQSPEQGSAEQGSECSFFLTISLFPGTKVHSDPNGTYLSGEARFPSFLRKQESSDFCRLQAT